MVERGDATYQVKCITVYVEYLFKKPIFYGRNKFVHAVLKPKFSILTFRATNRFQTEFGMLFVGTVARLVSLCICELNFVDGKWKLRDSKKGVFLSAFFFNLVFKKLLKKSRAISHY
jgi:hypothetical protein